MSYTKYPKEMKEAVIARMLQGDETIMDIQRDTGIGINTLYRWRDKALNQNGLSATTKYKNADKWSSQDKFTVVIWLEGDDPDCVDSILGGEIKMHMEIREEHKEQENGKEEK